MAIACLAFAARPALAPPALANDSTADLSTGGLDFVRSENVEMRSEQLFISTAEIRVVYHFYNKSDRPIATLVAFPMPDITIGDEDTNISVPTEYPVNFLAFTTQADGQPVDTQVEQKVFAKGLDRTEMLRELQIPLAPHLKEAYAALDALPQDKWRQLIELGIAKIVEYATGPDYKMRQHLEPRWTLKTTYYWQQIFPAQQELVIEHRYKPSVGDTAGTVLGKPDDADARAEEKKYCMEPGFVDRVQQALEAARKIKNGYLSEQRIDYVLKTGANWAGPIADFTLTLDKGAADNLMSFCGKNGLKKLSPTQFQLHYTNFTPTRDLAILILTLRVAP